MLAGCDIGINSILRCEATRANRRADDWRPGCHVVEHLQVCSRAGKKWIQGRATMSKLSPLFGLLDKAKALHVARERAGQMGAHGTDQSEFDIRHRRGELLDDEKCGLDIGWVRATHKDCVGLSANVT